MSARDDLVFVETAPGEYYTTIHCPTCGVLLKPKHLAEVTRLGSRTPEYIPLRCPTPKCGEVCKICRRDIGDVHGPDCGPLMFSKIERPHIVDRSDCT